MNKNSIRYELIFKMTKNGNRPIDFHNNCDDKGPTLTLIETKNNNIFGGFTPLSWNSKENNCYDKSKRTFLFSLNLMKKYDMFNRDKKAILCHWQYGPTFGNSSQDEFSKCNCGNYDISLGFTLTQGKINASNDSNFFQYQQLELTQGKGESETFDTKEIEIFKVIYE